MAGAGKEYTLTFLLKAASDSSYQAAFSKAKQELNSFQKQIQENNTVLRDISAYQRQEQAVERANQKLREKAQAMSEAAREAQEQGLKENELTNAIEKEITAVKNAGEKVKEQEAKLRAQAAQLKQAGVDTNNLAGEQQRLAKATQQAKQEQEALADEQNRMLESVATMEAMAAEAYVVAQAIGKMGEAWKACVDAASGFEYSMSGVEAVSGATKQEMSQLNEMAKELGASTKFTATEVADAMEYMGLAGWSASEMMEGMPAVVNLTAAAGEDLSRVCDIVTDSMQALGYGTESTTRFCDVLANTVTNANTTVDLMGDTLKYVSSTAGALGYSIEDVSTAIAAMANNGIKGSMNGTALRNVLANLAAPSDAAAQAMDELGISLVDSTGQAKGLNDVINNMRSSFAGLTQAQKVQYATTIAGKRGMQGLLALVNTSQEAYDELAATIADCDGAAEKMAQTRLDNFQGSVVILQSAFDALKTSIGEIYLDNLKDGAEFLTDATNAANEFAKSNQEIVVGASVAAAAMGVFALGVTGATAAMKLFHAVFARTVFANPAIWGVAAIAAGIAGVAAAIVSLDKDAESAQGALRRLREDMQLLDENQANIEMYQELSAEMQDSSMSADELAQVQAELDDTVRALKEAYPELLGDLEAGTEAWELQTAAILANIEAQKAADLKEVADNIDGYAGHMRVAAENYNEASAEADKALEGMRNAGNVDFSDTIKSVQEMSDALSQDIQTGKVEVDFDDGSEYMTRIKAMQDAFQGISGEQIEFNTLADVSEQLERYKDGADSAAEVTTAYKQQYSDAMNTMAVNKNVLDEGKQMFLDLADAGYAIGPALDEAGMSLADIGMDAEAIGQKVASGMVTAEDAAYRYGISMEEVNRDVQRYYQLKESGADSETKAAEAQKNSTKYMLQSSYAIAAVQSETMTAEGAAKTFGLTVEEVNEIVAANEEYNSNVEQALTGLRRC